MLTYLKWDEVSLTKLKELYDSRIPIKDVSFLIGRPLTSVKSALRKYGISRKTTNLIDQNIKELDDLELSYIAGIIDGEGCIGIAKRKTSLVNGERNPLYNACLKVGNTDIRLINWLIEKVGGGYTSTDVRKKRNIFYKWQLSQSMTLKLLEKVKKYLVLKKEQVEIVVDFRKTYGKVYSRNGTPREVVDFRDMCYKRLKSLHGNKLKNSPKEV